MSCFLPEPAQELARVRLVLQISRLLMHGAHVLHVQRGNSASECCLHLDDDFVSFSAHDGRNVMLFSTECQSFMRILDQALAAQEINTDYQLHAGLAREADELRGWHGGGEANVLADYVVACLVHALPHVAQMCWLDLFSDDETGASVVYEMRVFDLEVLDTKMAYTSLDEVVVPSMRNNLIGCHALAADMREQHLSMLEDEDLRRRQLRRRSGDMESDDEADDGAQMPRAQVHRNSDNEVGATQVYTPYGPHSP